MAEGVVRLRQAGKTYSRDVVRLFNASTTTEATYYPAIRTLLSEMLAIQSLPFDVRINTSERRGGGGTDLPDVAFYDGSGDFVVVCGEVKLPADEIEAMASSTGRNDQVGRYLAKTHAVLLSNVRTFGLLTVDPSWTGRGAVPPKARRLEQVVELWTSSAAVKQGKPLLDESLEHLAELVETAVTRYAPIAEPESLARILARQARRAKADLPERFTQAVQGLLDDFGKALGITFDGPEGEEFFRSSLIQTAFYGLFAGWALWWQGNRKREFHWKDLSEYLKIPFLGSLFYEFRHPSRIRELRLAKHLDIATETLTRVDAERFFSRFRLPGLERDETEEEKAASTAIRYFYEPFLEAFDPTLRKELGVWYTPTPIIRYQVEKIDRLLREELGCERGFADEKVIVLDPCCGTGAYLIEALRHAAEQLRTEGVGATLAAKLLNAACRRFLGFEILTAPFVVAQLQLYLLLAKLGATPDESHRPAVFLTNALTGWDAPDQIKLNFPELQEEHDAAQGVKDDSKIIVILGNPPYNRFVGVPRGEEEALADHYKGIRRNEQGRQVGQTELFSRWGVRKHLLDELYLRFFRLAEIRIGEKAEFGVVSFISNSSYLVGRSHPIMRGSLLHHFDTVWVDNLHGNRIASERTPWGESCETIFSTEEVGPGIKVGTCVSTFLKRPRKTREAPKAAKVFIRDFWGRATKKRAALLSSLEMASWSKAERAKSAAEPEGPREYEEVTPTEKNAWKFTPYAEGGFEGWPGLDDLFPINFQGVNPNRGLDGSVIETDRTMLERRMREYFSNSSFTELRMRHPVLCEARARYEPKATRDKLRKTSAFRADHVVPYLLFPLDSRWIYYEREAKLLNECRPELWDNLSGNEFLIGAPQARRVSESRPLIGGALFDLHLHDWGSVGFPAEVRPTAHDGGLFKPKAEDLVPKANLAENVWRALSKAWNLSGDLAGSDAKGVTRALFRLCLGICHAPQYEADHKDSLSHNWAHVPVPRTKALLSEVAAVGEQVAVLLNPLANAARTLKAIVGKDAKTLAVVQRRGGGGVKESDLAISYSYYGPATGRWEPRALGEGEAWREEWGETTGDLFLNDEVFFRHVPEQVWRHELGGYPVLKKWLGYRDEPRRSGRPLTLGETDYFRDMVMRIAALLTLRGELDQAYEKASGEAFSLEDLGF